MLSYLKSLVGSKFRYDHGYAILMRPGSKQLGLHGGHTPWDPAQDYEYRDGEMMNGLTVLSYALSDAGPDDGGFAVVPGSHKANFAFPKRFISLEETGPWVLRVPVQAGDAIIFSEACTHGTWPWRANHERRSLLYKYAPGHMAWASPYPSPADAPAVRLLRANAAASRAALRGAWAGRVRRRGPQTRGVSDAAARLAARLY